jgi:hypothetical protein
MTGQVSIEFLTLFMLTLTVFIVAASFLPNQLDNDDPERTANQLLKSFKLHVIAASTSDAHYTATIPLPQTINGNDYTVTVNEAPDNVASIKHDRSVLAMTHTPRIERVTDDDDVTNEIVINKTNTIEVIV